MKNVILLAYILIFFTSTSFAELSKKYQKQTAEDKLHILWSNISDNPYAELPGLSKQLFLQTLGSTAALNLKPTIQHQSDEIPKGRIKFIHTFGSCVAVELLTQKNPFTGVFNSGAVGIARLGWAAPHEVAGYIPGMAVKFLIDKNPSVNIQVMNSLDGQGDNANYFAKTFSNLIKEPKNKLLSILAGLFKTATSNPFYLPVNHLAAVDRYGNKVQMVVYPEVIKLIPRHQDWISKNSTDDLRETLTQVKVNSILYDLFGVLDGKKYQIGRIKTVTPFVNSEYCDRKLFFQHNSVESAEGAN